MTAELRLDSWLPVVSLLRILTPRRKRIAACMAFVVNDSSL